MVWLYTNGLQAAILGLTKDVHLVGTQYGWLGSIFYFGYLFVSPSVSGRIGSILTVMVRIPNRLRYAKVLCCEMAWCKHLSLGRDLHGIEAAITSPHLQHCDSYSACSNHVRRPHISSSHKFGIKLKSNLFESDIGLPSLASPTMSVAYLHTELAISTAVSNLGDINSLLSSPSPQHGA
jgi:hypothetical protein